MFEIELILYWNLVTEIRSKIPLDSVSNRKCVPICCSLFLKMGFQPFHFLLLCTNLLKPIRKIYQQQQIIKDNKSLNQEQNSGFVEGCSFKPVYVRFCHYNCRQYKSGGGIMQQKHEYVCEDAVQSKQDPSETGLAVYKRWTASQNKQYGKFLLRQLLQKKIDASRLPHRFFFKMSVAIKRKKTPSQCRSHHQKMLKTYGCLEAVLVGLQILKKEETPSHVLPAQKNILRSVEILPTDFSRQIVLEGEEATAKEEQSQKIFRCLSL